MEYFEAALCNVNNLEVCTKSVKIASNNKVKTYDSKLTEY